MKYLAFMLFLALCSTVYYDLSEHAQRQKDTADFKTITGQMEQELNTRSALSSCLSLADQHANGFINANLTFTSNRALGTAPQWIFEEARRGRELEIEECKAAPNSLGYGPQ